MSFNFQPIKAMTPTNTVQAAISHFRYHAFILTAMLLMADSRRPFKRGCSV